MLKKSVGLVKFHVQRKGEDVAVNVEKSVASDKLGVELRSAPGEKHPTIIGVADRSDVVWTRLSAELLPVVLQRPTKAGKISHVRQDGQDQASGHKAELEQLTKLMKEVLGDKVNDITVNVQFYDSS